MVKKFDKKFKLSCILNLILFLVISNLFGFLIIGDMYALIIFSSIALVLQLYFKNTLLTLLLSLLVTNLIMQNKFHDSLIPFTHRLKEGLGKKDSVKEKKDDEDVETEFSGDDKKKVQKIENLVNGGGLDKINQAMDRAQSINEGISGSIDAIDGMIGKLTGMMNKIPEDQKKITPEQMEKAKQMLDGINLPGINLKK